MSSKSPSPKRRKLNEPRTVAPTKGVLGLRSVYWDDKEGSLKLIEQRMLPGKLEYVACTSVSEVADAILKMIVRGAPAIGAAGAYGMALALLAAGDSVKKSSVILDILKKSKKQLDDARPTAVNLSWATSRIIEFSQSYLKSKVSDDDIDIVDMRKWVLHEAHELADQDAALNRSLSVHGAKLISNGSNILHHCNTGALATVDYGTALGVIFECHNQKKNIHVWVDETRPRLQGAKLTAWELQQAKIPNTLIADSASGLLMRTGKVDAVIFGADRVAANGDVANKVGTYKLSVVAKENNIPVYAAVPTSTIDLNIEHGDLIEIEERGAEEVTHINGVCIAPVNCKVFNPAFDVTPFKYLTGIITEEGVCYPPFEVSLKDAKDKAEKRIKEKIPFKQ